MYDFKSRTHYYSVHTGLSEICQIWPTRTFIYLSNFKFRGYLRPLWPKMPHISLFSFKYFIAREFFHIRLLSGYFIKIYQISLKLMCTLKWWAQLWKLHKFWNLTKLPFHCCITRFGDIVTTQNNIGVFKFKRPTV